MSPNWYDLGLQLLNTEQAKKLKTIKTDHPGDSEKCCIEMFEYWLQVDSNASWDKLLRALIQIDYVMLADRIRAMTSEGVFNVIAYMYVYYVNTFNSIFTIIIIITMEQHMVIYQV